MIAKKRGMCFGVVSSPRTEFTPTQAIIAKREPIQIFLRRIILQRIVSTNGTSITTASRVYGSLIKGSVALPPTIKASKYSEYLSVKYPKNAKRAVVKIAEISLNTALPFFAGVFLDEADAEDDVETEEVEAAEGAESLKNSSCLPSHT